MILARQHVSDDRDKKRRQLLPVEKRRNGLLHGLDLLLVIPTLQGFANLILGGLALALARDEERGQGLVVVLDLRHDDGVGGRAVFQSGKEAPSRV